jgi:hypothetical protein
MESIGTADPDDQNDGSGRIMMLLNQILAEIKQLGSAQPATMQALQNTLTQLVILKKDSSRILPLLHRK